MCGSEIDDLKTKINCYITLLNLSYGIQISEPFGTHYHPFKKIHGKALLYSWNVPFIFSLKFTFYPLHLKAFY